MNERTKAMDEIRWAMELAEQWLEAHGGYATGLQRQLDGRWWLEVSTDEPNWCPDRNLFVKRFADLGEYPRDED